MLTRKTFTTSLLAAISGLILSACGGGDESNASSDFSVGRTTIEWIDNTRTEACATSPIGGNRQLKAYLWYPAEPLPSATKAPLLSTAQVAYLAAAQEVPASVLQQLPSESYEDAPISYRKSTYPVLLMSHGGGGGSPEQYASTAEAMAAKGYVVLGLSHTYQSIATFFQDGSVIALNPACDPLGAVPEITETSNFQDFTSNWQYSVRLSEYFAADFNSALSQLDAMNGGNGKFGRRLELGKVGAFGHSFGGSHAFHAVRTIPRIVAAANIDGTLFSETYNQGVGVGKSLLTILGEGGASGGKLTEQISTLQAMGLTIEEATLVANRGLAQSAYVASRPSYLLTIPAAKHLNFSDAGLWTTFGVPTDADSVNVADAREILKLQNRVMADFFSRHLLGRNERLSVPDTSLKNVRLESRE